MFVYKYPMKRNKIITTNNAQTPSLCTLYVCKHLCSPSDHNLIVPSELADKHFVPSLFSTKALILSVCPRSFISFVQHLGSHTLRTFSVLPLTIAVPVTFIARLYIESLLPDKVDATTLLYFKQALY